MKLILCSIKVLLGLAVVLFSNGDSYIMAAGIGHIMLAPLWWYSL